MHHALEIQEILFDIFGYCYTPDTPSKNSHLAALARTCRAFKEPALDVLWAELDCLSPLVRCLPDASNQSPTDDHYSFSRPLTQIEWGILRSYTHRIRSMSALGLRFPYKIDWESIRRLSEPPTSEPLFPNLRYLNFDYAPEVRPLLLLPLPSLLYLDIRLHDPHLFKDSLESFAKISPNTRTLSIRAYHSAPEYINMSKIDLKFIYGWQNLQSVACHGFSPSMNILVYLSRMHVLTSLSFTLNSTLLDQIAASDSPLVFSNLHQLQLRSKSLVEVSRLLSHTRIPAITAFTAFFRIQPSKQDLSSFFERLQTSGMGHIIQKIGVLHKYPGNRKHYPEHLLSVFGLKDLRPCLAFSSLHEIIIDIEWKVDLTDNELLTLASAWPHLECFIINSEWGWKSQGGITPNGLLQFSEKCPSLSRIGLVIDTRGYTELPPSSTSLGLISSRMTEIDVLDSFIEAESVPAVAAFIAGIASRSKFSFRACGRWRMNSPNRDIRETRWGDVYRRVKYALGQLS